MVIKRVCVRISSSPPIFFFQKRCLHARFDSKDSSVLLAQTALQIPTYQKPNSRNKHILNVEAMVTKYSDKIFLA